MIYLIRKFYREFIILFLINDCMESIATYYMQSMMKCGSPKWNNDVYCMTCTYMYTVTVTVVVAIINRFLNIVVYLEYFYEFHTYMYTLYNIISVGL